MSKQISISVFIMLISLYAVAAFERDEDLYISPLSKSMIFYINEKSNTTWKAGPSKFDVNWRYIDVIFTLFCVNILITVSGMEYAFN